MISMEHKSEMETDKVQNETECPYPEILNKVSDSSDANISSHEDVKVKVEIELKEEENGLIYQPDFYGHLRLVSLNQIPPNDCSAVKNIYDWHYVQPPLSVAQMNENAAILPEETNSFNEEYIYGQLNNAYAISEETEQELAARNLNESVLSSPEMYDYSSEDLSQHQVPESSQDGQSFKRSQKSKELAYILAEKKRNYRNRIKEENPTMWCAMKQKEACKKREQREEKRFILLEMQKTMQLLSLPETPDVEHHKMYLQDLQDRYPEIWKQLIEALSAAEQRNNELMMGQTAKKRSTKPVGMYKDVVEAQKKYLYRQRIKLERPDLYEQQKARDSYARSIRRMLKKKLAESPENIAS